MIFCGKAEGLKTRRRENVSDNVGDRWKGGQPLFY